MGGTESKPTLVEIAYEKIRNKICDFELYPGQDVSDFTLCKELGMSRTPVRQALVQLEHDGLVKNAGIGKKMCIRDSWSSNCICINAQKHTKSSSVYINNK